MNVIQIQILEKKIKQLKYAQMYKVSKTNIQFFISLWAIVISSIHLLEVYFLNVSADISTY